LRWREERGVKFGAFQLLRELRLVAKVFSGLAHPSAHESIEHLLISQRYQGRRDRSTRRGIREYVEVDACALIEGQPQLEMA